MDNWVKQALNARIGRPANSERNNVGPNTPRLPSPIQVPAIKPNIKEPTKPKGPKIKGSGKKSSKPKKPQSALDKWLAGDSTYQQQLSNFLKEETDYNTQYNKQRNIVNRDYNTTQRAMNKQAAEDRTQQANDFAGRGILHSGVYAKALGDYNADFNTKLSNLLQGKTDTLGDLLQDRNNFIRRLMLDKQAARQDAVRRRAQQLGL